MKRYRVTWVVEVEAGDPQEALDEAQDVATITGMVNDYDGLHIREEPFDVPSPMWGMHEQGLRRLR